MTGALSVSSPPQTYSIPHRDGTCLAVPTILGREMADEKAIAASLAIVGPRTSLSNVERVDMAEAIEPVRTSR